jgi:hypothetical protein
MSPKCDGEDNYPMANLTGAERAKRYRQRKAGNAVPPRPRANAIWLLWQLECRYGQQQLLRTFYCRRAGVLSFLRHVDNGTLIERVTTYCAEIIPLIRNHTLFSEWNDFVARLETLGIQIEDKRHPLEALEAGSERRSAAPPVEAI